MGNTLISNPYDPNAPAMTTDEANQRLAAAAGGPMVVHVPYIEQVGDQLTSTMGIWTDPAPESYAYQWLSDGIEVDGADAASYTVLPEDIGKTFACRVFATHALGTAAATSDGLIVVDPAGATRMASRAAAFSPLAPDQPKAGGRTQRDEIAGISGGHAPHPEDVAPLDPDRRNPDGSPKTRFGQPVDQPGELADDDHELVEEEEDEVDVVTKKPTGQKKKVVKKVPKRR